MQNIKLIYIKGAEIGTRKMQSYPLGILSMQAYAYSYKDITENVKIDIDVVDYDVQDEAYVYEIYSGNYEMVLFSCYIWNITRSLEIGRKIKLVNEKIMIGLGGPEVDDAKNLLETNSFLDLVSVGEGEITFVKVIRKFLLHNNVKLSGVLYKDKEKRIIDTGIGEIIENLDEIPSVIENELISKSEMLLYETSRGCPFQCKYCCWAGKKMRYYSIERVEEDIRALLTMQEGTSMFIIDSELDIDIARAKKIMRMISKYNIHHKIIQGFLGLHVIDEELLDLCKKANFIFGIGIQSVNDETIKQCGRTWFNVKKFEEKIETIKGYYDIKKIEFQLIMGLPGDDYNSFRENLRWCEKIGATNITANRLYVLPGSYFYKNSEEYKIKYDKQPYHLVYSNYSYSYKDIMRSEALLVSFQICKSIFGTNMEVSSENGIMYIWDYIDSLVEIIEIEKMYSQGRQESQIIEINYKYENIMIENLKKIKCGFKEFEDYIQMNIAQRKANNFFMYDKVKSEGKKYIKINAYFMAPFVLVENKIIKSYNEYQIVFLHNFESDKIRKIRIRNSYAKDTKKILDDLLVGIELKKIEEYDNEKNKLFVQRLIQEKLCFYTNERGCL